MRCGVVGASLCCSLAPTHSRTPRRPPTKRPQFPTRAADPQGASKHLPTLEDEYKRYRLEEAIDSTLEDLAAKKQQQGKKR